MRERAEGVSMFDIKLMHFYHLSIHSKISTNRQKVRKYIKCIFISSHTFIVFFFIFGRKLHGKLRVRVPRKPILRTSCPRQTGRRGRNDTKIRGVVGRNSSSIKGRCGTGDERRRKLLGWRPRDTQVGVAPIPTRRAPGRRDMKLYTGTAL